MKNLTEHINLKSILKTFVVFVVIYNMVVVPLALACGVLLPVLVIDEATKTLLFLTTLGN